MRTLLYTHRYFHEAAHAEAQRAEVQGHTFSVVLVELTGIVELNWKGYAAGDQAIRTAARTVQHAASRHGGTACRQGGGHRLDLILPDIDERPARLLADELLVRLGDGPSVRVATASWRPGDDGEAVIIRTRAASRTDRYRNVSSSGRGLRKPPPIPPGTPLLIPQNPPRAFAKELEERKA